MGINYNMYHAKYSKCSREETIKKIKFMSFLVNIKEFGIKGSRQDITNKLFTDSPIFKADSVEITLEKNEYEISTYRTGLNKYKILNNLDILLLSLLFLFCECLSK